MHTICTWSWKAHCQSRWTDQNWKRHVWEGWGVAAPGEQLQCAWQLCQKEIVTQPTSNPGAQMQVLCAILCSSAMEATALGCWQHLPPWTHATWTCFGMCPQQKCKVRWSDKTYSNLPLSIYICLIVLWWPQPEPPQLFHFPLENRWLHYAQNKGRWRCDWCCEKLWLVCLELELNSHICNWHQHSFDIRVPYMDPSCTYRDESYLNS
jgi:hypothetical protein